MIVVRGRKGQGYRKSFFLVNLKAYRLARAYEKVFGSQKGTFISYWRILGYRKYRHKPHRREE